MSPTPDLEPRAELVEDRCGCCDGIEAETPQLLHNRPGLAAVTYRIGDYAEFRSSLHAALSSSEFPALSRLKTRDERDFTIALIDAFSCVADVLTFYQERLANESFLGTAVERTSLQELGKLVGYRLRPGVAAETLLAFALETPPEPPASLPPEPGAFVTGVPPQVEIAAGLQVQSVPGPGEKPQVFETVEALSDARSVWNAMRPWPSVKRVPVAGDTFTYFTGVANNLRQGDALLFIGDEFDADPLSSNRWDFRLIDSVEVQAAFARTLVRWRRPLGSGTSLPPANPRAYVLRRRAARFGHNAIPIEPLEFVTRTVTARDISAEVPAGLDNLEIDRDTRALIDLDALYAEVRQGSYAVLAKGSFDHTGATPPNTYVEAYVIDSVAEVSLVNTGIAGKVSRLELRGQNFQEFEPFVRETGVFAASQPLEFAEYPLDVAVSGNRIPVLTRADGLLPGRRLIVSGKTVKGERAVAFPVTLVSVSGARGRFELEVAPALAEPLLRDSVVVFGNVVLSSHGESASQVLGAGDAGAVFQRFELLKTPITARAAATELGARNELVVRVNDIAWSERDTLFGAEATERAFTVNTDEQGKVFVVFGDGVRGARLPRGINNVRAEYRQGLGAQGNVSDGKLTQLLSRPLGVKSVSNPLAASGGADPEGADTARASIPLVARTLGRAVSVLDYEDFARAFSGIAKAEARALAFASGTVIAISIAGPDGTQIGADSPVFQNLAKALAENGDPHVQVYLLTALSSTFRVGIRVRIDPSHDRAIVLAAVERRLRARYGFESRRLSEPVYESEVVSVAQAVPGVVAVDLTALYGGTEPLAQTVRSQQSRLLAARTRVVDGRLLPAELLTLHADSLELEEMP